MNSLWRSTLEQIFKDPIIPVCLHTGYFTKPGGIENATYESMVALLPIDLFVIIDIYEKVKIRRLKYIRTMRKQT
jgi:hypothetical protein